jgi:dienelactone hydrolase
VMIRKQVSAGSPAKFESPRIDPAPAETPRVEPPREEPPQVEAATVTPAKIDVVPEPEPKAASPKAVQPVTPKAADPATPKTVQPATPKAAEPANAPERDRPAITQALSSMGVNGPGDYKLLFDTVLDGRQGRRGFFFSIPHSTALANAKGKLPMVVFLHGRGEKGDDCGGSFMFVAIPRYVSGNENGFRDKYPFVFLCPQVPKEKEFDTADSAKYVADLIQFVCANGPVDPDRVYLTGLSMGGLGTWDVATEYPQLFAAIAPICSRASSNPQRTAQRLRNMPIWAWVGGNDGDFLRGSKDMQSLMHSVRNDMRLEILPGQGHGIWDDVYNRSALYEYFLRFRRTGN